MRIAVLGAVVGAGLGMAVIGAYLQLTDVYAQRPEIPLQPRRPSAAPMEGSGQLIALNCEVAEGRQQVTVIDPGSRVMSVYHIDRATGRIALKGVRNIHWDLLMEEFNGVSPSPREIRSLLPQQENSLQRTHNGR